MLMTAGPDAQFVQEFFNSWEPATRALVERYIAPVVSQQKLPFLIDLLRVIHNGVVLSAVEHQPLSTEPVVLRQWLPGGSYSAPPALPTRSRCVSSGAREPMGSPCSSRHVRKLRAVGLLA